MIIIGYPGIGKSTLAAKPNGMIKFIDLESSCFFINDQKPENWELIYANVAHHLSNDFTFVFVSSHKAVREALQMAKYASEKVICIAPDMSLEKEWISKLYDRYFMTGSEKDYRAYVYIRDHYKETITEIINSGFEVITLDKMTYDLEAIIYTYFIKRCIS